MAGNLAANFSKFAAGSKLPDANSCHKPSVLHADSQILNPARAGNLFSPRAGNFFVLAGKFMGRAGNSPGFTESGIGLPGLKRTNTPMDGRLGPSPGTPDRERPAMKSASAPVRSTRAVARTASRGTGCRLRRAGQGPRSPGRMKVRGRDSAAPLTTITAWTGYRPTLPQWTGFRMSGRARQLHMLPQVAIGLGTPKCRGARFSGLA